MSIRRTHVQDSAVRVRPLSIRRRVVTYLVIRGRRVLFRSTDRALARAFYDGQDPVLTILAKAVRVLPEMLPATPLTQTPVNQRHRK